MPFYEYECSACKFYVEALQKISEPPLRECPSCKKRALKRLVSAPVFRLKGGGWYETDFKSEKEGKRNLAAREESADTKAEAAKEAKTEAKDTDKPAESKPAESNTQKPEPKQTMIARPSIKSAAKPGKPKTRAKAPAKKKTRRG